MLAAPVGICYGGLALLRSEFDWGVAALGAGLTTIGGLLPDLDSHSGVPVRELFGITAAAVAVALFGALRHQALPLEEVVVLVSLAYFGVRYGAANLFRSITVHRGMYHSIPAMFIAGLVIYLGYPSGDPLLRLYLAGGVMAGFLSHLVLDEIYAVDLMGVTISFNQFAGSALKFTSPSWAATLSTYLILAGLGYVAWEGVPPWARMPDQWAEPARQWLAQLSAHRAGR